MISFKKINLNDVPLSLLQSNIDDTFKSILLCQLLNGQLVNNIEFTANKDTYVSHGLGRNYVGYFKILSQQFVDFKLSATTNNSKDKNIILQSNVDATCSLYIF